MNNNAPYSKISYKIEQLRFPLCIGVILIHCNILGATNSCDASEFTRFLVNFVSIGMPSLCVPLFFIISGYLISFKHISCRTYPAFLLKKFRTLALPYILWNILAFLIRFSIHLSPLSKYCSSTYHFDGTLELLNQLFIDPELIPLWFIRNLLIFNLIFPCLLYGLKRLPVLTLVLALIINENFTLFGGLIYFAIGIFAGINQKRLLSFPINKKVAWIGIIIYLAYNILMSLSLLQTDYENYISLIIILIGAISLFLIVPYKEAGYMRILSPAGIFFMYAFHGIISPYVIKSVLILLPVSGVAGSFAYLSVCILVITLSIIAWKILSKSCPGIMFYLTGLRKISSDSPL